jgi:hypothetical protein
MKNSPTKPAPSVGNSSKPQIINPDAGWPSKKPNVDSGKGRTTIIPKGKK